MVLVGKVPGIYVGKTSDQERGRAYLAQITIKKGIITGIKRLNPDSVPTSKSVLKLQTNGNWDIIYPGLIDLHNHNNQNVMPVWKKSYGRFANRFEWRNIGGTGYAEGNPS